VSTFRGSKTLLVTLLSRPGTRSAEQPHRRK
jgi:hypothetical protein